MADQKYPAAKVVLLAAHAAAHEDVHTLRQLRAQYPKALRTEVILRIILTHLPETLETTQYLPLIFDTVEGGADQLPTGTIDWTPVEEIDNAEAKEKVRKLHLLPLKGPLTPPDLAHDSLTLFLLHRAHRIDAQTGLITELPTLLAPFLDRSQYLRTWFTSILLPLLRFSYEYHAQSPAAFSLHDFEQFDDRHGINLLLSETRAEEKGEHGAVGRDLRGLIGPWMYGNIRSNSKKSNTAHDSRAQTVTPLDQETVLEDHIIDGWGYVFAWITSQATQSWQTAVAAVEQWDGPGDVDLGGYVEQDLLLDDQKQQLLERRYAQIALATAYLIPEASVEALEGTHRILMRIISLLDYERIPALSASASLLPPITLADPEMVSTSNAVYIRQGIYAKDNLFTQPTIGSTSLLDALILSAFLLTRAGSSCSLKRAGELVLIQDEHQQKQELQRLLQSLAKNSHRNDDKFWTRARNEVLWLRDWGAEELGDPSQSSSVKGVFGRVKKEYIELEILKLLLANSRFDLACSIYETSPEKPLSKKQLQDTILSAALNAYDNATNPNRTRGGVKRCDDIIHAFPETFKDSDSAARVEHLLKATHSLGSYRLVLKQGEPFAPVILRVHKDPISLIGKILDQNPRSYTRVKDLVDMGYSMIQAGLTTKGDKTVTRSSAEEEIELKNNARLRITSLCVDAALAEDDFETAYSYVMSNLESNAKLALASPSPGSKGQENLSAQPPPKVIDDWSWRAALQTGKYRRNERTTKPTHLGNASSNVEIRHLEQRIECLSLALRLAPAATLQEILNVYRRCEEELETQVKKEAEQEAAWDAEGDGQALPGSFGAAAKPISRPSRREATRTTTDDAPMSLFDLTRASAAQAQKTFSVFSSLQSRASDKQSSQSAAEDLSSSTGSLNRGPRKRDQLRDAAAGTLASGIGWLIGAPAPNMRDHATDDE